MAHASAATDDRIEQASVVAAVVALTMSVRSGILPGIPFEPEKT